MDLSHIRGIEFIDVPAGRMVSWGLRGEHCIHGPATNVPVPHCVAVALKRPAGYPVKAKKAWPVYCKTDTTGAYPFDTAMYQYTIPAGECISIPIPVSADGQKPEIADMTGDNPFSALLDKKPPPCPAAGDPIVDGSAGQPSPTIRSLYSDPDKCIVGDFIGVRNPHEECDLKLTIGWFCA